MRIIFFIYTYLLSNSCSPLARNVAVHGPLPNGYKICILGDSGRNNIGQKIVANALTQENCDQIRHVGDIIYPSGLESLQDEKFNTHFFQHYKKIINQGIPFYIVLGNHDYKQRPDVWIKFAKKTPNLHFPYYYYFERFGDICFISLETNTKFIQQYFWIHQLKRRDFKKCRFTMAFGHHPLYSFGKHMNATLGVRLFLENTIAGEVDSYFSGHDHDLQDVKVEDDTHYFISGAASKTRSININNSEFPLWSSSHLGFLVLTIFSSSTEIKIKYAFKTIQNNSSKALTEHSGQMSRTRRLINK